jgi:hypothetical protein
MAASQTRPNTLPNASLQDGVVVDQLGGRSGEELVAQLHGKYYTQAYRGNVFHAATAAAGVVLPIYSGASTGTAYTVALWNPLGSGKNLVPIKFTFGYVSTTGAAGNICYAYALGVGGSVGSVAGSTLQTFTQITPVNANLGAGQPAVGRFAGASGAVVVVQNVSNGTFLKTSGISQFLLQTGTANTQWSAFEEFDGTLIIPPGCIFYIGGNIAILSTFTVGATWEEVPA